MNKLLLLLILNFCFSLVHAENILRMSTTTSTENSGLLAVLNPPFEKQFSVRVDVIAVGTGKALRLGENGDVDVVFVHAPEAEQAFIDNGFGVERKAVMHNDFIIVGPKADPLRLKSAANAHSALNEIHRQQAPFISRGDDSGTHKKEQSLWRRLKLSPSGNWYVVAGQGMGAVLRLADDKQAYTLTDYGTFISYQDNLALSIVYAGDINLHNPYHIMAVNPERNQHVKIDLARKYIAYVTGVQGQKIIADYQKKGQQLFYPDAILNVGTVNIE